jgi:hypothetical protein
MMPVLLPETIAAGIFVEKAAIFLLLPFLFWQSSHSVNHHLVLTVFL